MQKIALYACVTLSFSTFALGSQAGASLLTAETSAAPARQSDVLLARRGADDGILHLRHGRGRDDAPGDDHGGNRGNDGSSRGGDDHSGGGHGGHGGDDSGSDDHGGRRS